jgi:hypothetical protein
LRASRAVHYRGGVPVGGEDLAAKVLGEGYTRGGLTELAIRRVFEREGISDQEKLLEGCIEMFKRMGEEIRRTRLERGRG